MRFRRFAVVFLVLALAALLVAGCGGEQAGGGGEPQGGGEEPGGATELVVGTVGPLSGDYATYGVSVRNGVKLAIDEINASGMLGDITLRLQDEDTGGDQAQAANAVNKLINQDNVTAIIGAVLSGETNTAAPFAQEAGVPIMTPSSTAPGIADIGDYVFQNVIRDDVQSYQMGEYAVKELGLKKLAILYSNNDYGVGLRDGFKKGVEESGGEVVAIESYLDGDSNFSAQLTNISGAGAEGLYVAGYYTEAAKIAQQARQIGFEAPLMGADGLDSPQLIELGGDAVEGTLFTSGFYAGSDDPTIQEFVSKFEQAIGSKPDMFAANAYDSMYIIAEAIKEAGTDRAAIRDAIAGINYDGITGTISFSANGEVEKDTFILKISDGQVVQER